MTDRRNETGYDSSLERSYCFYDQLPYERNMDVCGNDCIRRFSGNVIKNSSYSEQEVREIPNQDALVLERIRHQQEQRQQEAEENEVLSEEEA